VNKLDERDNMSTTATIPSRHTARSQSKIYWPAKFNLFGVHVSATNYDELVELVTEAARTGEPAILTFHAAHAIVESIRDPAMLAKVNGFDVVATDGHPVRWALNSLHGTKMSDRVYGPELMNRLCARAADESIPIYLYGSSPDVIEQLKQRLLARYPALQIAGAKSPPFRALTPEEDADIVREINESGAGIVFIGLGCPKQDHFAADHADRIGAVQLCVGAAFDFHAGTKSIAPRWMQRHGLEWLYRLACEPRRLVKRYLVTNSIFLSKWVAAWLLRQRTGSAERSTL
jgi:exopolysaccharide biosynthesis WecB/TagA/CpsF family protein